MKLILCAVYDIIITIEITPNASDCINNVAVLREL